MRIDNKRDRDRQTGTKMQWMNLRTTLRRKCELRERLGFLSALCVSVSYCWWQQEELNTEEYGYNSLPMSHGRVKLYSSMDTNTGKRAHSMILLTQEAGAGGWQVWSHFSLHKEPLSLYNTHRSRDGGINAIWSQGLEDNCKFKASQSHRFTLHKLPGPFQALICGSLRNISTEPKAWHKIKVGEWLVRRCPK